MTKLKSWEEGKAEARAEGRAEGRAEARAEGRAEARAEGRAEACTKTLAKNVLTVFRVRGIAVPDATRERILAEKDLERLGRWHEKAIIASSSEAVVDDPS